jgi:predicted NAD/FAD-binding protein
MAPLKAMQAIHYVVVCCSCHRDATVCPRRTIVNAKKRAEEAFQRAGWHEDGASASKAASRWYCPTCARAVH